MSKGRKNGCPVSVNDWLIEIQNKGAVSETWVRINGLDSMTLSTDGETDDGSTSIDLWEEPFVKKRSGSLSLEGKPKIDETTGDRDAGQALLNEYAVAHGCDGDATIRMTDPYGHRVTGDFIVTSHERSTNEDGDESESWDLELVGELETNAYVSVTSIALTPTGGTSGATTLSIAAGATNVVSVGFTPTDSSNQRFRVKSSDNSSVAIVNTTTGAFTLKGLKATTSAVTVTVTSVNGSRTATIAVTVTNP